MQNQPTLSPQQQQELARLQQLQQSLEVLMQQRTSMEAQFKELEFALRELESTPEDAIVYKSVGGLFIKKSQPEVLAGTKERKEMLEMRVKSLSTQEARVKQQYEELRKKLQGMFNQADE